MLPPSSLSIDAHSPLYSRVKASRMATNTFNPIRNTVEKMNLSPNPEKKLISLSIGDPTIFGNLTPPQSVIDAIQESLHSGKRHGYAPSTGFLDARAAVANHISKNPDISITADDVILCSGCSCSLDLCISVLADPGDNILVPRPGFPLYATLAKGLGIDVKEYNLLPEQNWEVDVEHLESLIDNQTRAIVINNPSNPCGSVFSEMHLMDLLNVAERHGVPVIADEIYEHFVFAGSGKRYVPMASLNSRVPILSCGGLTKRYLVPGWRLGWVTIHDANGIFKSAGVRDGLHSLSQRIIGSNTLVQGALPAILENTPESFFQATLQLVESNAKLAYRKLSNIPGLKPTMPEGAMYMMVGIDLKYFPLFRNDLEVVEALMTEESVFCLPGKCFNIPNFIRIVLTVPEEMVQEACDRIFKFCLKHCSLSKRSLLDHLDFIPMEEDSASSSMSSNQVSSSEDEADDDQSLRIKPFQNVAYIKQTRKISASSKLA